MRHRLALYLAAGTVAALVLAPLLAPGYVLSYDMNFVPDQPLRWDLLAPTDAAPRAVPLDAAVSLANTIMPGWLLQRLVLVGIIVAAVVGAGRLVPAERLGTRLIAGIGYGWTPFLAERLLIGQWGLLLAYAALPWLVRAALGVRSRSTAGPRPGRAKPPPTAADPAPGGPTAPPDAHTSLPGEAAAPPDAPTSLPGEAAAPPDAHTSLPSEAAAPPDVRTSLPGEAAVLPLAWVQLPEGRAAWAGMLLAAGVSALTPTGGLIAAAVCLTLLAGVPWRRFVAAVAALAVLNSPWLVAAMITSAGTRSDPGGVDVFAARGENWAGPVGALLSTGGIWNADTTPTSRSSPIVPLVTLIMLVLAILGYAALRRRLPGDAGWRLGGIALASLVIAALATVPAGASLLRWLVQSIPGAGLLRDGQKFAMPYALILVLCVALGAERLAARLSTAQARVVLVGVLLLPVVSMADLAYGGAGALRPVRYPADWQEVAAILSGQNGEVLALPLSEYRRYPWNHDRVVIDPAPRYLPLPVLVDDRLVVGPVVVEGENPRLARIRRAISAGEPVAAAGIPWVLVQHPGPGVEPVPATVLQGLERRYVGDYLTLFSNPQAIDGVPAYRSGVPVIAAEAAALAVLMGAAGALALVRLRRPRVGRGRA